MTDETEISCKVRMTCQMISKNPDAEGVLKVMEKQFRFKKFRGSLEMISWVDLVNPDKMFIHDNNSIVLEVKLKISEIKGNKVGKALERPANDGDDAVKLESPICFDSLVAQPSFSLICGHIFCGTCSEQAMLDGICPSCKRELIESELQKVFLPYKK